jgi:two-component system sensor histidine kinase UhpB
VSFDAQGDFGGVSSEAKLCLYRVTQEGLRNAVNHASARHGDVRLTRTPAGADLTIADDGRGFDVESRHRRGGLGLKSIGERVRLAGGTVSVESGEDRGTTLKVHLPIDETGAGSNIRFSPDSARWH